MRGGGFCAGLAACGGRCAAALAQVVQFADVFGELSQPLVGVFGFALLAEFFFSAGAALQSAFGQRELVGRGGGRCFFFQGALHFARGCTAGRRYVSRLGVTGELLAKSVEVLALQGDGLARFGGVQRQRLVCARQFQHGTGLEPVHIATHKSVGVSAQHGQQHLVQRHIQRFGLHCQLAGRVSALNGHAFGFTSCFDWCGCRAGGRRCRGRLCSLRQGRHLQRRCQWRHRLVGLRRREQQRVVARELAAGPGDLQRQFHKRLCHGAGAG